MDKKIIGLFIIIHTVTLCLTGKMVGATDPFSKIVITSNKAICQKDKKRENIFVFSYLENVFVTFADKSTIQSDELEIELDTTQIKKSLSHKQTNTEQLKTFTPPKPTKSNLSQFKKITFKNNVVAKRGNRTVQAHSAELYLTAKICKLLGNVRITQTKEQPKDLPLYTACSQAILNLANEQVTFLGNPQTPVSTTIELVGHPSFTKNRKKQKRKKRYKEKK